MLANGYHVVTDLTYFFVTKKNLPKLAVCKMIDTGVGHGMSNQTKGEKMKR
jgi:hypothetical protein